jgi:cysteine desulfurase/selenocysteine lyase
MALNQPGVTDHSEHEFDVGRIKGDFPILSRTIHDKPLVFLDSAASSQKPRSVLQTMDTYYETINANVHRAAYTMAEEATNAMEAARLKIAGFIGATDANEVVFTKNATESINLIARSWGARNLAKGDAILLTHLEHHANIVPWQQLAAERELEIRWIPLTADCQLDLSNLDSLLDGVKIVGLTSMSNVVGTITPVRAITDAAHAAGAVVAVDACQSVPHLPTDVHQLGADFLSFSGHKMLGPTGIGVLWARKELLDAMPPFLGGGGMILDVRLDGFLAAETPHKFEAGTPPIAEIIGLGAAVDYLNQLGMAQVRQHEVALTAFALEHLANRFGDRISLYGPQDAELRGGVMSFAFDDIHPHDLSQVLDQHGICVRPGHHCAKPLMRLLGVGATARASWYVYNDEADITSLGDALEAAGKFFTF